MWAWKAFLYAGSDSEPAFSWSGTCESLRDLPACLETSLRELDANLQVAPYLKRKLPSLRVSVSRHHGQSGLVAWYVVVGGHRYFLRCFVRADAGEPRRIRATLYSADNAKVWEAEKESGDVVAAVGWLKLEAPVAPDWTASALARKLLARHSRGAPIEVPCGEHKLILAIV